MAAICSVERTTSPNPSTSSPGFSVRSSLDVAAVHTITLWGRAGVHPGAVHAGRISNEFGIMLGLTRLLVPVQRPQLGAGGTPAKLGVCHQRLSPVQLRSGMPVSSTS